MKVFLPRLPPTTGTQPNNVIESVATKKGDPPSQQNQISGWRMKDGMKEEEDGICGLENGWPKSDDKTSFQLSWQTLMIWLNGESLMQKLRNQKFNDMLEINVENINEKSDI